MIETTIYNPANPQICRREALRMGLPQSPSVTAPPKEEPVIYHLSQGMQIGAKQDLIRQPPRGRSASATFPKGEGGIRALHRRQNLIFQNETFH